MPIREIVHVTKATNKKGIAQQSLFEMTRKFTGRTSGGSIGL
jgi:hypothetical protein